MLCLQHEHIQTVAAEVLTSVVMKSFIFWDFTLCSLLKASRNEHEARSSEMSVNFLQLNAWHHIPVNRTLHSAMMVNEHTECKLNNADKVAQ
jgi:hypothetical protein